MSYTLATKSRWIDAGDLSVTLSLCRKNKLIKVDVPLSVAKSFQVGSIDKDQIIQEFTGV